MKYDFTAIEAKWQKEWEEKKLFKEIQKCVKKVEPDCSVCF